MKLMLRWFVPSLALVASLAACQVELGEDLQFECTSDKDCSEGFVCRDSPSVGTRVCVSENALGAQDAGEDAGDATDAPDPDATADTGPDTTEDTGPDADRCSEGETLCDGECVDTSNNQSHCGGCGQACTEAPANSMSTCEAGTCKYTCEDGYTDSNGDWTGVEDPADDTDGCDIECTPTNGGVETCDGQDNDCDGETDEGVETTFYPDADGDSFGDDSASYEACQPTDPAHVEQGGDCNDSDSTIHPDAVDICADNVDNDCDGITDNGALTADQVVVGANHSCALVQGEPYCWGQNHKGQIGDGTTTDRDRPTAVDFRQVGESFESLVAGQNFTCGLTFGKEVWCWGSNRESALGQFYDEDDPNTEKSVIPVKVQDLPTSGFLELAAGNWHVCGVTGNKEVYCWGNDGNEQLGRQVNDTYTEVPGKVEGGHAFWTVTAGANHTCALEEGTNTAYCWGRNFEGQVGDGSNNTWIESPSEVGTGASAVSFHTIAAGGDHTCASDGSDAYCWGANTDGQIGDGTTANQPTPVKVQGALGAIDSVGADGQHSCGRVTTGDLACWGKNEDGQLGDGSTNRSTTPVTVQSTSGFGGFELGDHHTCGRSTNSDEILCWGWDLYGQLGNGSSSNADVLKPEPVLCPQ